MPEHRINLELRLNDEQMLERAVTKATEDLTKQLKSCIFDARYSWSKDYTSLNHEAREIVRDWLNENKEELYELIAIKVADSLRRSSTFREQVKENINE